MADPSKETNNRTSFCHRPLSRASRQLFRQDASHILLHYFGGRGKDAPWRQQNAAVSSDPSVDPAIDKRGRKRTRISLVDTPDDELRDEEWYALLGYAIDKSIASDSVTPICPLHPKHDMILSHDRNSFILHRRYRPGASKFGAYSLPWTGRAARAALWSEERDNLSTTKSRQSSGYSVFLFQCGICGKSFLSQYYLDKHMEEHHPHEHEAEINSPPGNPLMCPANHVCEALGGASACVETMNEISPYYGRGMLLGKEYVDSNSDSSLPSSIHSLMAHFNHGSESSIENTEDIQLTTKKEKIKVDRRQYQKEADFLKVAGEMRHRAVRRNKMMRQVLLHRHLKTSDNWYEENSYLSNIGAAPADEGSFEDDFHPTTSSSLCNEEEMERFFHLCRDMMHNCFGDCDVNDKEHRSDDNSGYTPNISNELINHICEPLHCEHRLHRMAGHNSRHAAHWNDQWDEHHSFSLGYLGWIVVLGVVIFYVCAFTFAMGDGNPDSGALPRKGRKKNKSM